MIIQSAERNLKVKEVILCGVSKGIREGDIGLCQNACPNKLIEEKRSRRNLRLQRSKEKSGIRKRTNLSQKGNKYGH